jgi:Molecular chaperone GrpE (heat shock protein)
MNFFLSLQSQSYPNPFYVSRYLQVFKRHGLEPINPLGEKFDPNFHEALFEQEVEGKEANTVVVVSKIGYKLYNRVIRPALVGISKS